LGGGGGAREDCNKKYLKNILVNQISVITVCYNNLQELISTCVSVDTQTIHPFEHIIIDGSSNASIRTHLESNPQPHYRKWICESDNGIADAFNKGIEKCNGSVVNMLNSGDKFINVNVIEKAMVTFAQSNHVMWLHGMYELQRGGQQVKIGKPFEKRKLYRGMRSICHQTMFVKKVLHSKYGVYDVQEKIGMDYDFLCRIANEPFLFVAEPLVLFAPGGISNQHYLKSLNDARRIYEKYYGKSFRLVMWQWRLRILHYLLVSPIGQFLYKVKKWLRLENM
jgi:glycosyltransferase involved in cell wall biosynthesis